jgi:hypothetical protein
MIRVDISKFVPATALQYLAGLDQPLLCHVAISADFGGLLHDCGLARWRYNPVLWGIVKLRVALGQLRDTSGTPSEEGKSGAFSVEQADE